MRLAEIKQHRFISEGKAAIKISVPTPDNSYRYRSVGFKKIGKAEAFKQAIQERNRIGEEVWGKFWGRVLSDHTLFCRLPKNLEPTLRVVPGRKTKTYEYTANWVVKEGDNLKKVARRYSCNKHTKLGAYIKAKQALLDAYKNEMKLLVFMGRAPIVSLH
ncbi:hypothetical protein [Vibrio rotiferianus]|uniref:hypothetical protein n=1 Tax=Vibrio rotiferianus TaxID=190895 RepID=UPI0005EDD39F|nr:hypothetical protein [Vibrio rotiferianus]